MVPPVTPARGSVVLLLPPSEGKAAGGVGTWKAGEGQFAELERTRRLVIGAVRALLREGADLGQVTETSGALAERAREAWRLVVAGRAPSLPAWQRFTGVVWEHLEPEALTEAQRRRIVVVNGLTGLSLGTDPVPDFRLKMSVNLPGLGRVDRRWEPLLAPALTEWAKGRPVVNLLPAEHARAVGPLPNEIKVSFLTRGRASAGHGAKAVKGRLARTLLRDGPGAVEAFEWEAWTARRTGPSHIEVTGG